MPVYEYACEKCGHEFEREQRITDAPVKTCPRCRARKVRRLISRTAFVLKGGGWYSDLYSSPQPGGGKEAPASGDSKGESKGESKGDKGGSKGDSGSGSKSEKSGKSGSSGEKGGSGSKGSGSPKASSAA
jgi:putative FmdB family regulatory protein